MQTPQKISKSFNNRYKEYTRMNNKRIINLKKKN